MISHEGIIKGSFKGFRNRNTTFEFTDRSVWRQNEYKYCYHYAYRPRASVLNENGRLYLKVDGMSEQVEVKRLK